MQTSLRSLDHALERCSDLNDRPRLNALRVAVQNAIRSDERESRTVAPRREWLTGGAIAAVLVAALGAVLHGRVSTYLC